MIEAMAYELSEDEMGQCFDLASSEITKWEDFQKKLSKFLRQYDTIEVIADWPEDFWHFTQSLLTGPGMMMDTPKINMIMERRLEYKSVLPHNALEDAKAIRSAYLKKYTV
jgi:hypothetical protein